MNHSLLKFAWIPILLVAVACTPTPETKSPIHVTGQAELSGFPSAPTSVRATRGQSVVAESSVAADGSFELTIPAGAGYAIDFLSQADSVRLIFPRQTNTVESRFNVLGAGDFNLGTVRYIGDPGTQSYLYLTSASALESDTDNVQCEDGIDAVTGAVCVDDEDDETAEMCGDAEEGGEEGDKAAEVPGVDCENGIDTATGLECDGGPAANPNDGGAEEEDVVTAAAVADHNLPAAVGCPGEDGDDVNCEDGIDPATGLECDGGPAANQ